MKLSQEKIDRYYRISQKTFEISSCSLIALLMLQGVYMALQEADVFLPLDFELIVLASNIFYYTLITIASVFILSIIVYIPSRLISKRNKQLLDEHLSSHLIGVTPNQEKQILRLLKRAAKPSDGSNKMNRSEVATLLATLKEMQLLEDAGDFKNLRLWVEQETGLIDPDNSHFNEAYRRALKKEIDPRYETELKKILDNND